MLWVYAGGYITQFQRNLTLSTMLTRHSCF